jgi:hypothetical protein
MSSIISSNIDATDILAVMLSAVEPETHINHLDDQLLQIVKQGNNPLLNSYFFIHPTYGHSVDLDHALGIMRAGGSLMSYGANHDNDKRTSLIDQNAVKAKSKLGSETYCCLLELGKKIKYFS